MARVYGKTKARYTLFRSKGSITGMVAVWLFTEAETRNKEMTNVHGQVWTIDLMGETRSALLPVTKVSLIAHR